MVDRSRSKKPAALRVVPFVEFTTLRGRLAPGQLAFAMVAYDGAEPSELPPDLYARGQTIFGGVATIPAAARRVIVQTKGRDVGGTRLAAEAGVRLSVAATLDRNDPSELVYVVFGGPKLRHARVGLRFALACAKANRIPVEDETSDGFTVVRPDGRRVRFECFAASRGGDTFRGVPILFALLDEAGFYFDESTGVVNAEAIFGAIIPRLLPGGQIVIVSSPWAESGLLYDQFTRNFGNPTTALAAHCPTALMRDDAETLAMVALEYERDAENAERELGANFLPAGTSQFFDSVAINNSADETLPDPLPTDWRPAA